AGKAGSLRTFGQLIKPTLAASPEALERPNTELYAAIRSFELLAAELKEAEDEAALPANVHQQAAGLLAADAAAVRGVSPQLQSHVAGLFGVRFELADSLRHQASDESRILLGEAGPLHPDRRPTAAAGIAVSTGGALQVQAAPFQFRQARPGYGDGGRAGHSAHRERVVLAAAQQPRLLGACSSFVVVVDFAEVAPVLANGHRWRSAPVDLDDQRVVAITGRASSVRSSRCAFAIGSAGQLEVAVSELVAECALGDTVGGTSCICQLLLLSLHSMPQHPPFPLPPPHFSALAAGSASDRRGPASRMTRRLPDGCVGIGSARSAGVVASPNNLASCWHSHRKLIGRMSAAAWLQSPKGAIPLRPVAAPADSAHLCANRCRCQGQNNCHQSASARLLSASSMLQELGLNELKCRLKQWEREFQAEAGHRPSAKDVDRDPEIRRLYRRYSELRSLSWQAAPAPSSTSIPAASTASSLTSELGAKLLNNLQQRRLSRAVESCRDSEMSPVARAPASPAAAPPSPLPPPSSPRNSDEKTSPSPSAPVAAGVAKAAAIKPARLSKSACRFSYLSKSNCQLDSEPPLTPASDQQQLEFRSTYSSGPEPAAPFESVDLASLTVAKQQEISVAKEHLPVVKPATFDFLVKPAAAPSATPPHEDSSPAAGKENSGGASAGKRKSAKRPAVVSDEEENGAAPTTKAKPKAKAAKRPRSAVPPVASSAAPVSSFAAAPSGGGSGFASSASSSANYVKVNLRVKRFSRGGAGKGRAKFRNFKRAEWKRKSRLNGANANRCFACGEEGHWADKCPRPRAGRREATDGAPAPVGAPAEDDGIGEEEFSDSLVATPAAAPSVDLAALEAARPPDFPGDLRTVQRPHSAAGEGGGPPPHIEPLADEVPTSEVRALLRRFGHADFRPGQADAIGRVLAGRSALVVMTTGAGKSLCYQLPALLYHSKRAGAVALVISPLQALMEDQLSRLPACLPAACLHSGQSAELRDRIRADAAAGRLACLLVSPEMLVDGAVALRLPAGVSFACIDEAHCLADWSHHFRPAYLRVLSVLRSVYSVRCFLGLTATAGPLTARSVARLLDADPLLNPGPPLPSNLRLSASSAGFNKTEALLQLFYSEPYKSCGSILIYCGSRAEAEAVAGLLRTSLGGAAAARAYHAGMSAAERRRAQRAFTSGRCRILAATVALGMGLDKPDVRCVLHFSPPASYRDYVQEVGRAGRDGDPAYCHTLLAHPPRRPAPPARHPTGVKALIRRLFPVKPDCRLCAAGAAEAAEADEVECEGGAGVASTERPSVPVLLLTRSSDSAADACRAKFDSLFNNQCKVHCQVADSLESYHGSARGLDCPEVGVTADCQQALIGGQIVMDSELYEPAFESLEAGSRTATVDNLVSEVVKHCTGLSSRWMSGMSNADIVSASVPDNPLTRLQLLSTKLSAECSQQGTADLFLIVAVGKYKSRRGKISQHLGCSSGNVRSLCPADGFVTAAEIRRFIGDVVKDCCDKSTLPSRVFVAVSAHGGQSGIHASDGQNGGAPAALLYFGQSCRGCRFHAAEAGGNYRPPAFACSLGFVSPGTSGCVLPLQLPRSAAIFASMAGYKAYRHAESGSFMPKALLDVVSSHGAFSVRQLAEMLQARIHELVDFGRSWPPGGHLRALDIAETVAELDATEETIETLLCYLQLRFPGRCRLLGRANSRYRLSSYSGPAGLAWAASRCLCVAAALADRAAAAAAGAAAEADDGANPTIDLAALCDRFGWDPSAVGRDLAGIEWNDSGRRSGVVAKPERPAWMLLARCCQGHEVADRLANHVIARLRRVERCALSDMRRLHRLLARSASVAADHGNNDSVPSNQEPGESSGDSLHDAASRAIAAGVFAYFANSVEGDDRFEGGAGEDDAEDDDDAVDESTLACVRAGVRAFIGLYGGEHRLTARNIACVMHGIGTPNFPAVVWGRVRRFWRLHEAVPWPAVRRAALEELLATLSAAGMNIRLRESSTGRGCRTATAAASAGRTAGWQTPQRPPPQPTGVVVRQSGGPPVRVVVVAAGPAAASAAAAAAARRRHRRPADCAASPRGRHLARLLENQTWMRASARPMRLDRVSLANTSGYASSCSWVNEVRLRCSFRFSFIRISSDESTPPPPPPPPAPTLSPAAAAAAAAAAAPAVAGRACVGEAAVGVRRTAELGVRLCWRGASDDVDAAMPPPITPPMPAAAACGREAGISGGRGGLRAVPGVRVAPVLAKQVQLVVDTARRPSADAAAAARQKMSLRLVRQVAQHAPSSDPGVKLSRLEEDQLGVHSELRAECKGGLHAKETVAQGPYRRIFRISGAWRVRGVSRWSTGRTPRGRQRALSDLAPHAGHRRCPPLSSFGFLCLSLIWPGSHRDTAGCRGLPLFANSGLVNGDPAT
uniref:DNA 3'-5' helicase n=1 Tax=Macrostomum lignano TaxID=282301 RepID=A0A1I8ILA0_9PLAT